uniref:winged helix-turn-helix domain-containing protein n=1 Tax=Streptomyces cyaneochromogenes TaxID=2496836 RepID=UPI001E5B1029|nr:winged helix-turn-helix domain-containing protein [Streptomyces cyaneochromogenes]
MARQLRVSMRSVQRWHQACEQGGTPALESKGPASRPKLSEALFAVLEQELAKGPVAHGWPDHTWTLARIKTLIGRRFHKSMTLSAIAQMLHRHGFSHQAAFGAVVALAAAVAGALAAFRQVPSGGCPVGVTLRSQSPINARGPPSPGRPHR